MKRCLFFLLLALGCDRAHTTPPGQFLLPLLRSGGARPTTPTNLRTRYAASISALTMDWVGSIDPDTGLPNVVYSIYAYELPPREYYRRQDILATTTLTSYYQSADHFTGSLYFVVTAFDGGAESLPSNVAQLESSL
ncbi:MAG TPA: hypothetical protein PK881_13250 [Leptospiraceae bacterium]|nr:hypothetical protein [Leptospiraceae bacterium]